MQRARTLIAAALLALAGCGTTGRAPVAPLAERIWDTRAQAFISVAEVEARVGAADYALLGETHDNPRHHEIQLRLLERAARDAKPAVAFEQVDREWQGALDAARAAGADAQALMQAGHVATSWSWRLYEPLFAFAASHGLRILATNYSRERARALVARGLDALPAAEAARLAIADVWSPGQQAKQRALIVEGHCGQDDPIMDKLVDVQRVRDATMADAILEAPRAVAILGRGHARADVGVPLYLAKRAPDRRVVSVALVEVDDELQRPQDYEDAAPGAHDIVWFTPRAARADPCAGFKPIAR